MWIAGDISGLQALTDRDHLYADHINELRSAIDVLNSYDISAYGAVGDGVTDDGPAVLAAMNAAGAVGAGEVSAPPGTYLINSVINCIYGNIRVRGSGIGVTTFLLGYSQTDGNQGMFYFKNTDNVTPTNNLTFEDFSINMNGHPNNAISITAPITGTGTTEKVLFRNIEIYGRGPDNSGNSGAIKLRGIYNSVNGSLANVTFDHVYIHDGVATDVSHQTATSIFVESNNIDHLYFKDCYFKNTYGSTVVFTTNGAASAVKARKDILFQNCSFINTQQIYYSSALGDIVDSQISGFDGISVLGCTFRPSAAYVATVPDAYCMQIYNSNNFIVDHCIFDRVAHVIAPGAHDFGQDQSSAVWTFSNNLVFQARTFSDPDACYAGLYDGNVFYRLTRAFGIGYSRHYPTKLQNNLFFNCLTTPEDLTHEYTQAIINLEDGGNIIENNTFFNEQQQSTPSAPSVATGAAGGLTGAYLYKITFVVKDLGETDGGTTSAAVSPSSQKVSLTNIPLGGAGVTSRRIYRTAAGGGDGTQKLVAELDIQVMQTTTSYTDNIPDSSLGAAVPTTNTTISAVKYIFAELGLQATNYNPSVYRNNTFLGQAPSSKTFYLNSDYAHIIAGNHGLVESTIQNSADHTTPNVTALPSTDVVAGNFTASGGSVQMLYAQGNVTGATTFNRATGEAITATLIGNITVTLTASGRSGEVLILKLTQDGTGSRTATWPGNFKKAGGTLTLTTTAGATDIITARYDGTNWVEVSRALNVS